MTKEYWKDSALKHHPVDPTQEDKNPLIEPIPDDVKNIRTEKWPDVEYNDYIPRKNGDRPTVAQDDLIYHLSDLGNAERFADYYKKAVVYSPEQKAWYLFRGTHWQRDTLNDIYWCASEVVKNIYSDAATASSLESRQQLAKHAIKSESNHSIEAMLSLAEKQEGIPFLAEYFNHNQWVLNVRNGTIDLKTGKLEQHNIKDYFTDVLLVNYEPEATSAEWLEFLNTIFNDDQELINYVQKAVGYSATGEQGEQTFFFCHGGGFNGKSQFLAAIRNILGFHAIEVPSSAFMIDKYKRGGGPDEVIASLYNKRFATSTELEDGQRLSVALIKRMTGGESLRFERKFEHGHNFRPTHKLWLAGNHEPIITDTTNSIWLRLKYIPFMVQIPEDKRVRDYGLLLAQKYPAAILNWIVEGCLKWQNEGLTDVATVKNAVATYREQQDILHDFIIECCAVLPSDSCFQADFYKEYKSWCDDNDAHIIGKNTFNNRLREKGLSAGRGHSNKATWQGIRILTNDERVNLVNLVNENDINIREENPMEKLIGKSLNGLTKLTDSTPEPPDYPKSYCKNCMNDEWELDTNMQYRCKNGHLYDEK